MKHYFRFSAHGLENIPTDRPVIVLGNHSGGVLPPDPFLLFHAWYEYFGRERYLFGLAHDSLFIIPPVAKMLCRAGMVRADPSVASRILHENLGSVLVYPGGGDEMFRTFSKRHRIEMMNRKGFIRLALTTGAPLVPAVAVGGHETLFVLSEGRRLARLLRMDKSFRLTRFPISFILPWGITSGYLPYIPLPAKITIEFCPPIFFPEYGPADANNPEVLQRCYDLVFARMQQTLNALADARRFPILG
jgi:1-acyl-sn-glycerol-3-phosphate acyltransferase